MKKTFFAFSALGIVVLTTLCGCSRGHAPGESGRKSIAITRGNIVRELRLVAPIRGEDSMEVHSEVEGRISRIYVEKGKLVQQGEKIASIEDADALTGLREAELNRDLAECELESCNKNVPAEIKKMQLKLQIEELKVEKAKRNLDRYDILATQSGKIGNLAVRVGDYVAGKNPFNPGSKIVDIVGPEIFIMHVTVGERDIPMLKLRQAVTVTIDAIPGLEATGTIMDIQSVSEQGGVANFPVTIQFTSMSPDVKLGMTATAKLRLAAANACLLVPVGAVHIQQNKAFLRVINGTGVIRSVEVALGIDDQEQVEITGDVAVGDRVQLN